jgi:CspA family cold shock protein
MAMRGVVKSFNRERGHGVIHSWGADIIVHVSAVVKSGIPMLSKGDIVEFDTVIDPMYGTVRAENIVLIIE